MDTKEPSQTCCCDPGAGSFHQSAQVLVPGEPALRQLLRHEGHVRQHFRSPWMSCIILPPVAVKYLKCRRSVKATGPDVGC